MKINDKRHSFSLTRPKTEMTALKGFFCNNYDLQAFKWHKMFRQAAYKGSQDCFL